jgi:hypothetical protein
MRPRAQARSPIQTYAKLGGGSRINPTVCQIWMIPWHTCRSEAERNVTQPGRTSGKTPQSFRLSDGTELTADQFVFACGSWLGKALPDVIGDRVAPSRQHLLWRYARRFPLWRGTAGDSRWGVRQRRDRRWRTRARQTIGVHLGNRGPRLVSRNQSAPTTARRNMDRETGLESAYTYTRLGRVIAIY